MKLLKDLPYIRGFCWAHLAHYNVSGNGQIIWVGKFLSTSGKTIFARRAKLVCSITDFYQHLFSLSFARSLGSKFTGGWETSSLRFTNISVYFIHRGSLLLFPAFCKNLIFWRTKNAGRFEKLLGFARSHFIATRGSVSLLCATTPHPSCFSKS